MKKLMTALVALCLVGASQAQTIYRCGNAYSDVPCPGFKEVDILPTDGMHSLSGTKRTNVETQRRELFRGIDKAVQPLTGIPAEEMERRRSEARAKSIPRIPVEAVR